jgi:hypothetical protein
LACRLNAADFSGANGHKPQNLISRFLKHAYKRSYFNSKCASIALLRHKITPMRKLKSTAFYFLCTKKAASAGNYRAF